MSWGEITARFVLFYLRYSWHVFTFEIIPATLRIGLEVSMLILVLDVRVTVGLAVRVVYSHVFF